MIGIEARERTGRGQYIETVMLTSMAYAVSEWGVSWAGKADRMMDRTMRGFHALHRLYETADGWLYLECHRRSEWRALCSAIGRSDLAADERFEALLAPHVIVEGDVATADRDLAAVLERVFGSRGASEWQDLLLAGGVPAVRADGINHLDFMLNSEQVQANEVAVQVEEEGLPLFWRPAPAVQFSEMATPHAPSAGLGDHTEAVLRELGYTGMQIAALESAGVTVPKGNDLPD